MKKPPACDLRERIAATASVWSRRQSKTCMADEQKRPIETMEQLIEAIRSVPGLADALPPEFTDPRTDFDELRERFWRS